MVSFLLLVFFCVVCSFVRCVVVVLLVVVRSCVVLLWFGCCSFVCVGCGLAEHRKSLKNEEALYQKIHIGVAPASLKNRICKVGPPLRL